MNKVAEYLEPEEIDFEALRDAEDERDDAFDCD